MRGVCPTVLLMLLSASAVLTSAPRCSNSPNTARSAHWVIRTSDLAKTLEFCKKVLNMRVIRHEENREPCPITCNGNYKAAWSKTMVGYNTEDKSYCLEVTYNYGTTSYKQGTGLQEFAITVHDPLSTLEAAATLGYASINHTIVGPDGYRIKLLRTEKDRSEPFQHVTLRVRDLSVSTHFYTAMLGMHSDPRIYMLPPQQYRVFSYHDQDTAQQGCDRGGAVQTEQVPIVLLQAEDPTSVAVEQWEGRHAISMPEAMLRAVYGRVRAEARHLIVHEMQELPEALGVLVIAIIKDPDGYEICLVSSETFDKAVLAAADWKGPDWDIRKKYEMQRLFAI